jgi:hypothetical protein
MEDMFQSIKVIKKDNADVGPVLMRDIVEIINCNTTVTIIT